MPHYPLENEASSGRDVATAAKNLIHQLTPLLESNLGMSTDAEAMAISAVTHRNILSAIYEFVPSLSSPNTVFACFHDGQVHDPLGSGSYAFQQDLIGPVLRALVNDETNLDKDLQSSIPDPVIQHSDDDLDVLPKNGSSAEQFETFIPKRPIVIHAGVQPNNSPHAGTLVVFCYTFALAQAIRERVKVSGTGKNNRESPPVSVEITFVDTAPVNNQSFQEGGIHFQKSYRDTPSALGRFMQDYNEVIRLLSAWSEVPYSTAFQSDLFSHIEMPMVVRYIANHHHVLGPQLSPKYGKLALRAACPVPGCGLAEKHGRLNVYTENTIAFHCPSHGSHKINMFDPTEVAKLEANAPVRNLIRSMTHLLDTSTHHVRVTGADYAGAYQEMFLYRPLAVWSSVTGLARGRTPHILYSPLVVDWSGAKLSKSLYVREGGYTMMKMLEIDGLCSFAQLKSHFSDNGSEGLRRFWEEVKGWMAEPKKLFRTFSVEYLQRVIMGGSKWSA